MERWGGEKAHCTAQIGIQALARVGEIGLCVELGHPWGPGLTGRGFSLWSGLEPVLEVRAVVSSSRHPIQECPVPVRNWV